MSELTHSYDERGDVLYLTVGSPDPSARSRSDEHGFIWRTSMDGVRRAVTIENARAWLNKRDELEKLLAQGFGVARKLVHKEIREFA
jgi:uncharacterized protein YuzE